MGQYTHSLLAEADIDDITAFTIRTWDIRQADRYLAGLEALCQRLADGEAFAARSCPSIAPGLLRIDYVSHVVFFRKTSEGVRIVRILHEHQLREIHSFEDDTE